MAHTLVGHLKQLLWMLEEEKLVQLRNKSNELIEEAALEGDELKGRLSLIAYALHKMLSKPHIAKSRNWEKAKKSLLSSLSQSLRLLEKNEKEKFGKKIDNISGELSSVDAKLGRFLTNTFEKAKAKQASRAYTLGLSLSRACELTGAEKSDVFSYIGGTKIHEQLKDRVGIRKRLYRLRKAFE